MSEEKPKKAKPLDTPEIQLLRAFALLSEHSDACVVLLSHKGGLFVRFNGGRDIAAEMLRVASNLILPDRKEGEVSMEFGGNEGDE